MGRGVHHVTSADLLDRFRLQDRALEPMASPRAPMDFAPAATSRSFTVGEVEAALCIWGTMLCFRGLHEDRRYVPHGVARMSELWDAAGWQAMRACAFEIVPVVLDAYASLSAALEEGGFTFDFDFIPAIVGALSWSEDVPCQVGEPETFLENLMSAVADWRRHLAAEALASDNLSSTKS